ncbi:S8 family peptidase [Perlabentimonas gracilis]|uniref:S8 family peptidase n=1 Tax=Perlabentimonas gracilis TaxID=2715279 RepID=UPI001408AB7E|nr:S8 family serine peptidase [Perlabentimonas gracilis]NHB69805.1 S8 family serine peptidase [Perlabentimonas gracilis]
MDYNSMLNLPDSVKQSKGEGVVIAIVDTGCAAHSAFSNKNIEFYDAATQNHNGSLVDSSTSGHGTSITGIIAGNNLNGSNIVGVAPLADVIVIKATNRNSINSSFVLQGLTWLLNQAALPHIVNMSFDIAHSDAINSAILELTRRGVLVVAAGQNDGNLYRDQAIFYPARNELVLGVGALSQQSYNNPLGVSPRIHYVLPNLLYFSTGKYNDYKNDLKGCSFATAVISASLALVRASLKTSDNAKVISTFNSYLSNLNSIQFNQLNIYKNENARS